MLKVLETIRDVDEELASAMESELDRQRHKIELIASENFTSLAVMQAQGSWLTNKYAEGLPGKRYYGGCEHVDDVETLAINRANALFGSEHANVQPHSGAQANMAVFFALLDPGDKIMGMNLSHGGHLTHGSPVNVSGKYYEVIPYGVSKETGRIDYEEMERLAIDSNPKLIIAGASAYPREIDFERISHIAKQCGACFMVDMAHIAGLVATGLHPSPVPHADVVTTTTHKTLRGPRGGLILCKRDLQKKIDKSVFPGMQGGPLMHVIAAKAVAFKLASSPEFIVEQTQVVKNAKALGAVLSSHEFNLLSGGTDTHLVVVDLQNKGLTGKVAEEALDSVGITVNKNSVPFDPESPFVTSGIRIGTPAVTARGMKEDDARLIGELIVSTLNNIGNENEYQRISADVRRLTDRFPLYPEIQ